jgi:hypothetical protein
MNLTTLLEEIMLNCYSIPHHIDATLVRIKYNLHSDLFLEGPDEIEHITEPFPTNGDRCMAVELTKRLDPAVYPK